MRREVTNDEIREVCFSLHPNKAPSLDGFNAHFFKKTWHIIGDDVINAVQEFFRTGLLLKELNATILTLVPKPFSDDSTPPHPRDLMHYVLRDRETHCAFNAKVEIPEFEGKMQPDEFIEWLNTVDRIFKYQEVPEHRKVKLVAIKLRKHASFWWENFKKQRDREERSKILTWIKMKKELTRKYLPDNYRQDVFLKIQNFRQKDLSIAEYTVVFDNLMLKGDLMEPEEQTIARYLGGLNYEISNVVQLQPYWTFNDGTNSKSGTATKTIPKSTSKDDGAVANKPQPSSSNASSRRCFKCQGFGHIASECPNRRIVSLVEEENEEEMEEDSKADYYNDQEEGEEVTYADHGSLAHNPAKRHSMIWLKGVPPRWVVRIPSCSMFPPSHS
ncbi:hypothetical protein LWI29_002093 [Acer saccharum]|uniref:CCHC-type domain-containing protein n=1 Tax=Acer saccharum TaxID=4024 RepID=A0AA39SQH3_ACESA|nr:hypothetical protein LWI29_002093 [Acer saccharum]